MRSDEGKQSIQAVDNSEEIYIHDLVEVFAIFPASFETNSSIESKKGDFT